MADSIKTCPICSASNHRNASVCWNCGTSLAGIEAQLKDDTTGTRPSASQYDFRYGETDLYENAVFRTGQRYLMGCFGLVVAALILGLGLIIIPPAFNTVQDLLEKDTPTPTSQPQMILPTVTQGPPTLTPTITVPPTLTPSTTPTREPCLQRVQAGDYMFNIVVRCGHLGADATNVFDSVVDINNLSSAGMIIEGQVLEVPWPTPTIDPNAQSDVVPQASRASDSASVTGIPVSEADVNVLALSDEELAQAFIIPTATLPPGIEWHTIQSGETIISIIVDYNANIEILRDLNPELTFTQCNMGFIFGGESCSVLVNEGQQIRVPAPTLMPTLSPTPNGSETPTPTPTATFNAPVAQSPPDRSVFRENELITLRWVATGTLGEDEVYRVAVEDRSAGVIYSADTLETFFIIPQDWQGVIAERPEDEPRPRHDYQWTISVIRVSDPQHPSYQTIPLTFSWESRIEN